MCTVRFVLSLFLILFLSFPSSLQACPCGCGSSDFLSLEPQETFRYRIKLGREFNPYYYDGNLAPHAHSSLIRGIETYEFSATFSPIESLFLSFDLPLKRNIGDNESRVGIGDPSLHLLASAFEKDINDTYHVSLRPGFSIKLPISTATSKNGLNIFSNGHWELSPNFSTVFTYREWAISLKETLTVRFAHGDLLTHPIINRFSFGLSYTVFGVGNLGLNLNQEIRFSQDLPINVNRFSHDLKWNLGVRVGEGKNLGLSYKHPILFQKSTPFYHDLSLSFTHSL